MPTLFQSPTSPKKPETAVGPLTCFAVNPDGIRFETQEEEEKVILFLRQHIIVNVGWVLMTLVLLISPIGLVPFALQSFPFLLVGHPGYMVVGTAFWYLATFGFALASFIHWFFNIYIVTNERIVDIDFIHLLFKQFSQAEITKIQDISYSTGGILATVFDYGNVLIETAGEFPNLEFASVPHPGKVVEAIRNLEGKIKGDANL